MANAVTLADLRARALDYADMTGSSFPVAARVNEYINTALSELYDACVNAYDDYFLTTTTITIVAGTETYAVPNDFYKLRKLWYLTGNRRYKVERFSTEDISGYKTSPITAGTAELWYVPQVGELTQDGHQVDTVIASLPKGWEDYAALSAAAKLLMREESVEHMQMIQSERDRVLLRIISMLEPRDIGEATAIQDVTGRWSQRHTTLLSEERYFKYRLLGQNIHLVEIEYLGV